ncbi:DinB family protein [Lentibacillus sediminis]|uniref:DinB family protein n=1 Tax=Lentibacillus sediminis TaxID=1940529 RepID=UPI000C1C19CE|nr:DinB family protein [Lentibacillus sediminis]
MQVNEKARGELLKEVNGLSDEVVNQKLAADQWSIKQVLEHLYLMEATVTRTIEKQLANGEATEAKEKPIERTVNRKTKVDAPEYLVPSEDFRTLEELKKKLAATHQGLSDLENRTNNQDLEAKTFPHPAFGDLSLKQWIPFVGYHEMRHTEQIKEVKVELGV